MRDKVVIVTGAGSGIGRATAIALATQGADVVLSGMSENKMAAVAREIGALHRRAIVVVGDVAEEETAAHIVDVAVREFGGLDAAFNNAGIGGETAPIADLSLEAWQRTHAVNVTGMFLGLKYQAPAIAKRGGGAIVCSTSASGTSIGLPGTAAYATSKAGITGLVKVAAVELAAENIRVNCLAFGAVDTPGLRESLPEPIAQVRAMIENSNVLKRMARPEEAAAAALFLLSEGSSFITGTTMVVDGGMTISRF